MSDLVGNTKDRLSYDKAHISCICKNTCYLPHSKKPVFRVSDEVRHIPGCVVAGASWRLEYTCRNKTLLSRHGTTKVLIALVFLVHLSQRLIGELIGYSWSGVRPSVVRPSVVHRRCRSQCSKIFFSETAGPIKAKFYVEPPWVGELYFVSGIWVT